MFGDSDNFGHKSNRRTFMAGAASLAFLTAASSFQSAHARQTRPLRIAFPAETPPYSWHNKGECKGLLPELFQALVSLSDMITPPGCRAMPRKRAIVQLEKREVDGFCTYPAGKIRDIAYMMSRPLIELDYGYIIYNRLRRDDADRIQAATGFGDLTPIPFFAQRAAGWEEENVPDFIDNTYVTDPRRAIGIMLARDMPGFMIMPKEQAIYLAGQAGLAHKMGIREAGFIPNRILPYHISIRQNYPDAALIAVELDNLLKHPLWAARRNVILSKYSGI